LGSIWKGFGLILKLSHQFRVDSNTRVEHKKDHMKRLLVLLECEPATFERVFLCCEQDSKSTLPQVVVSWNAVVLHVSRVAQPP